MNFSYIVAPRSVTPGDSFTVYVHVQDINRTIIAQFVSVRMLHSSNGLIDVDGPRIILSGTLNVEYCKTVLSRL